MKSLLALLLVPAVATQPADEHINRQRVTIAPVTAPQEFTVTCDAGERVLGGGYADTTAELRVIASHPIEGGWSLRVVNPSKVVRSLEVSVKCGTIPSSVVSASGMSVRCPIGTVVTGGGYRSEWLPRQGGAAISGSYPSTPDGWAVDTVQLPPAPDAKPRAEVTVYAVCSSAVRRLPAGAMTLEVPAGTAQCAGGDIVISPGCHWPRAASASVNCAGVVTGGGYQVLVGRLPHYSVLTAAVWDGSWRIAVSGRSDTSRPLALRLTPICVTYLPGQSTAGQPSRQTEAVVVFFSAGLMLLLMIVVVTRRGTRRPAQHGQVAVVLRANRGGFRLDELREVQ